MFENVCQKGEGRLCNICFHILVVGWVKQDNGPHQIWACSLLELLQP